MVDRCSVKCLVLDDDQDGAQTVGAFLAILGADVRVVYSGQEAVDLALNFQPRVVVLDINVPAIDGFEICRRLRQQQWARDALFVVYTGLPPLDGLGACFDRVISKGDPPNVFEFMLKSLAP